MTLKTDFLCRYCTCNSKIVPFLWELEEEKSLNNQPEHQHDAGRIVVLLLPILQIFYNAVDFFSNGFFFFFKDSL